MEEKEELKKKIEQYFESKDPEMIKLGRSLCHGMRIDYYVITAFIWRNNVSQYPNQELAESTVRYSVYRPEEKKRFGFRVYQIKLEKWN